MNPPEGRFETIQREVKAADGTAVLDTDYDGVITAFDVRLAVEQEQLASLVDQPVTPETAALDTDLDGVVDQEGIEYAMMTRWADRAAQQRAAQAWGGSADMAPQ